MSPEFVDLIVSVLELIAGVAERTFEAATTVVKTRELSI